MRNAVTKATSVEDVTRLQLAHLRRIAAPVLESGKPLALVAGALREGGYGGDLHPALLTYLAATSRVLAMRQGTMPAHLLLVGPPSSGKSYTIGMVLRLLPRSAYHVIDAGSPRVLIYETADLEHRVLIFGEADSLPAGEDNPAASAVRNLLQDNWLHYKVTLLDRNTGKYRVHHIKKKGPTALITTSTRRLGDQLESRLFCVEVPDDQAQVRKVLHTQAMLELQRAPEPPRDLVAYQELLQRSAPWDVVVPFAEDLAQAIGRSPVASRVLRDHSRILALIKAVAVLRHQHRRSNAQGQLEAAVRDYAIIYHLLNKAYSASLSGVGEGVREVVRAVAVLKERVRIRGVTGTLVAQELGVHKMAASRRIRSALRGGWLVNSETRRGYPQDLRIGEPLPEDAGLPRPEVFGGVTP